MIAGWCKGSGSVNEPYRLENITIDSQGSGSGIFINNSKNVHFTIKNCTITNSGSQSEDAGIKIVNSENGTIIEVTCAENNYAGIYLNSTINCKLDNLTVYESVLGIRLFNSNNTYLSDSTFYNNTGGIDLEDSNSNSITDNSISNSTVFGISLYRSEQNNITRNNIERNGDSGIYLDFGSNFNSIRQNTFKNNGKNGIWVESTSNNNSIRQNTLKNNGKNGIWVELSNYNRIIGNTITENTFSSVNLTNSDYCRIVGNDIDKNIITDSFCLDNFIRANVLNGTLRADIAIAPTGTKDFTWEEAVEDLYWCKGSGMWGDPYIFENMTFILDEQTSNIGTIHIGNYNKPSIIRNNVITNLGFGYADYPAIDLENIHNATIENNNITPYFEYGIRIRSCSKNTIMNNLITTKIGIYISNSNDTTVSGNSIENCTTNGIKIDSPSQKNIFFNNYLKGNEHHAIDNGIINYWNKSMIGNYWSNYSELSGGEDANDDRIGDVSYPIDGSAKSIDYWPIWDDGHNGTKIHIDDSGLKGRTWEWMSETSWCSGSGDKINPYILDGLTIDCKGSGSAIIIENSNFHFIIKNCLLENSGITDNDAGIKLNNTRNGVVMETKLALNLNGILLFNSSFIWVITNCNISKNTLYGIGLFDSNNILIEANIHSIDHNHIGIYLNNSHHNTIDTNSINYNNYGIYLNHSNYNAIYDNIFYGNGRDIFDNGIGNTFTRPITPSGDVSDDDDDDSSKDGDGATFILLIFIVVGAVAGGVLILALILKKKFSKKQDLTKLDDKKSIISESSAKRI